jgi:polysaccharide biosynthesis protein PslH
MKLVLLTPQTPYPPDQGAPIRNFSFIRQLGGDSRYEVYLLSFARPGEDPSTTPARTLLERFCRKVVLLPPPSPRSKPVRVLDMLLKPKPDLALRLAGGADDFRWMFDNLLNEIAPDAVLCEGLEMTPFALPLLKKKNRPRLILDDHNAEYLLQQRIYEAEKTAGLRRKPAALYSRQQAQRLSNYEKYVIEHFDRTIAVSEPDKAALEKIAQPKAPIAVIPNGIDLSYFEPGYEAIEQTDNLVFTGTMDFRPNVDAVTWFVREVWPIIQQAKPHARFLIVGRRPSEAVRALKEIPGITVTGEVLDARPYIKQSAVYVVPMRMGGGVRFKVLEALAMSKAVVTTSMGADGIALTPGHDALFADEPQEFAAAVLHLLDKPESRAELAARGRALIERHYDWRTITPLLDKILLS